MAITKRQRQVYDFIAEFVQKNQDSPSFEEIGEGLGQAGALLQADLPPVRQLTRLLAAERRKPRCAAVSIATRSLMPSTSTTARG